MKIIIEKKNPLVVYDEDGNILFEHKPKKISYTLEELETTNLEELGLSEGEIHQIKHLIDRNKRSFY